MIPTEQRYVTQHFVNCQNVSVPQIELWLMEWKVIFYQSEHIIVSTSINKYTFILGGKLEINTLPQMITLTFNGAVNIDNILIYRRLFHQERLNPNSCTAKATFFVSHKYTNYRY